MRSTADFGWLDRLSTMPGNLPVIGASVHVHIGLLSSTAFGVHLFQPISWDW